MKFAVIFNGPPRSGKDSGADAVVSNSGPGRLIGLHAIKITPSDIVKEACHGRYGLVCHVAEYEDRKDTPLSEFEGRTPRNAYIEEFEVLCATHGPDALGHLACEAIRRSPKTLFAISGSGSADEARPIVDYLGAPAVLLIRVMRQNMTFDGDVRRYFSLLGVEECEIENDDLARYQHEVCHRVNKWLSRAEFNHN